MIKDLLKKNQTIYALIRVLQQRKNKRYMEITSLDHEYRIFYLSNDEIKLNGRAFYLICDNWGDNGFFAIIRRCMSACAIADEMGFIPYVDIRGSLYNVDGVFMGTENMFLYYFRSTYEGDDIKSSKDIVRRENYVRFYRKQIIILYKKMGMSNGREGTDYVVNEEYLRYMGGKLRKYAVLKNELWDELHSEIGHILPELESNMLAYEDVVIKGNDKVIESSENNRVIGVHFRGSDYAKNLKFHPKSMIPEEYFSSIDNLIRDGYEKVFLATDDSNALKVFKDRYSDRLICFDDDKRSENSIGIHMKKHTDKMAPYYLGREVIRDMLTLSFCDGVVVGVSQVSVFSRMQRYAYTGGNDFCSRVILDNGIN